MAKLPEGYTKFTKIEDCYVTGIATIAYMVIEKLFDLIMPTLMAPMCKVQEEGEEKKRRVDKMASQMFKLAHFIFSSVWLYVIAKDAEWFPWQLGGSGDFHTAFKDLPYADHVPGIDKYL